MSARASPKRWLRSRSVRIIAGLTAVIAFLSLGGCAAFLYGRSFWRYRSFPPPVDPPAVHAHGRLVKFDVTSAALGGRSRPVFVYLPPGYDSHPDARYPALYLLHGVPGVPTVFLSVGAVGMQEDILVHERRAHPMLLVMPTGSFGFRTDTEWVDGIHPGNGWDTYVARDVVRAVDQRFRTIATGAGRGIAGSSEGGYAALNIALHHPGEFHLVEGWLPYTVADGTQKQVFGNDRRLLRYNSPLLTLSGVARELRRSHTFVWLLMGTQDPLKQQTYDFASELHRLGVSYELVVGNGKHRWAFIRPHVRPALLAASEHLAYA